ncbi:type VI secretion system baseplate subunit TssG [Caulobacter flavus]|uniref:Type VI secretion system baseplate subunit TssG n=1 Tax=Caulobacter flavus TaxID=1679497 RepID=A0A2N5CZI6_9CAUL|nr:type VI secretion system baseplate subunit TssG [Caulobacter flavus]AYV45144.1 type VI secretion system baseplate subunit TssG [Caulobacter flavus]PLR19176.1 type VI secretion system baseplate subunit TssG [Caulobacter flavus]
MAAEDGSAPDHLRYLQAAREDVRRYGFFALVRGAEARAPDRPRVGRAPRPDMNIVDLAHSPSLDFPGSTLDAIDFQAPGRATVRGFFLGLTGPMGPLPIHMTELAQLEARASTDRRPLGRFLDLLTARMLQFFYRAWANSQPVCHADRPGDDRFRQYLTRLTGAAEAPGATSAFGPLERLHYAGVFASRRSPLVLQRALSDLLATPVEIVEFTGGWCEIARSERTRLGAAGSEGAPLGGGAVLGDRVQVPDAAFTVMITAPSWARYRDFLPGGALHDRTREAVEAWKPSHLAWDLVLGLNEDKIGRIGEANCLAVQLGGEAQLGWTSWMAPQGRAVLRHDARLQPAPTLDDMEATA